MKKTRTYSGLFIVNSEKEEEISGIENVVKTMISDNSGKVIEEKPAVKKRLAYPMDKKTEGAYYEVTFEVLPSAIEKITHLCNINTNIIRTIINIVK